MYNNNVLHYYRIKELCINLVIETSLYYDELSEKYQTFISLSPRESCLSCCKLTSHTETNCETLGFNYDHHMLHCI
jgi:hypothetical protein